MSVSQGQGPTPEVDPSIPRLEDEEEGEEAPLLSNEERPSLYQTISVSP